MIIMQVQHSHNQFSHAQAVSTPKTSGTTKTRDQFQIVTAHQQNQLKTTYQQLAKQAKIQDIQQSLDVSVTSANASATSVHISDSLNHDPNISRLDTRPESTPQATLEKAQDIKQQILHNQDPSVHNPQLLMKAQLLERKAKAQLHKDQMTQRFVKAPRLL
jgi:hypothetical protein